MISDQEIVSRLKPLIDACDELFWHHEAVYLKHASSKIDILTLSNKIQLMQKANKIWNDAKKMADYRARRAK